MPWRDNTMAGLRPRLEITELEPPRVWAETGRWRGIRATLTMRSTPTPTGCRVRRARLALGRRSLGGAGGRRGTAGRDRRSATTCAGSATILDRGRPPLTHAALSQLLDGVT